MIGKRKEKPKALDKSKVTRQKFVSTNAPINIDDSAVRNILGGGRIKKFVITAAQNATPVKKPFFESLKRYCKRNQAQLLVVPYRYHNPTSHWGNEAKSNDWWDESLLPYMLVSRANLSSKLVVFGDMRTQPTMSRPLDGIDPMSGGQSCIVPHCKLELRTVATPQNDLAKIMATTGAVTEKNFIESRAGKRGEFHHSFAAVVVEVVDNGNFFIRQLNSTRDGSFCDLDRLYTPDGTKKMRPEALVMGDTHVRFIDQGAKEALFGVHGMVTLMKPKQLVWHDVFDSYAISHWHEGQVFTKLAKLKSGYNNLTQELKETFGFVDNYSPAGTINVFPYSNHPDMIARWINRTNPKEDLENCVIWAETFKYMAEGTKMTENGEYVPDPFEWWASKMMKSFGRSKFLGPNDSYTINGIEVGMHGHLGSNGARGSLRGLSKIGVKSVIGHSHTPGIIEGAYSVGTTSVLRMAFMKGPSSHSHAHCWIYKNGKRSLQFTVGSQWRG